MPATHDELIARAEALIPTLQARAAETEALRKPHDANIQDLLKAELLQMCVPAVRGGSEASLSAMLQVVEKISSGCISTGWISAFYISHNIYAAKFSPQAQDEVFGAEGYTLMPAATAPTMKAEKVEGGYRLTGKASWGSGIMHADWVMVSGVAADGPKSFVLPIDEVKVLDVWHFAGMAGTGSNDLEVENVFVPDHRVVNAMDFRDGPTEGSALHPNPMYSLPFILLAYCTITGVLTGGLQGAMREYEALIKGRVRNFSGAVVKDQQHAQIELGEMQIRTQMAHAMAQSVFDRIEAAAGKRKISLEERIEIKGQVAFISKHVRDTVNRMMENAGASNYHLDKPIQRFWRDLNTVCSHAFWDWDASREQVGRVMLDLPPNNPLI